MENSVFPSFQCVHAPVVINNNVCLTPLIQRRREAPTSDGKQSPLMLSSVVLAPAVLPAHT